MGFDVFLDQEKIAGGPMRDEITAQVMAILGDFTIAIGRYDFTCDEFMMRFSNKHHRWIEESRFNPPFNKNEQRAKLIMSAIEIEGRPEALSPFEDAAHLEKSMIMLFEHRKNVQHAKLTRVVHSRMPTLFFAKLDKETKTDFAIVERVYSLEEFHEIIGYADDCTEFVESLMYLYDLPRTEFPIQ